VSGGRALLLWTGLAAAPLAWLIQLFAGYEAVDGGCAPGGGAGSLLGRAPDSTALGITLAAVVLAGVGLLAGLSVWISNDDRGYMRFLGFAGAAGSVLLLATILLAGAGILALDPCGQS
jgi:hypothetical protein